MRARRAFFAAALLLSLLALLGGLVTPVSNAEPTRTVTVDFDDIQPWTGSYAMDPLFFKHQGIQFAMAYRIGFGNFHAQLIANAAWNTPPYTITATFSRPVTSVLVSFQPRLQGTAQHTLTAYSDTGGVVGSSTITLTEDGLDGSYHELLVDDLDSKAKEFSLVAGIDIGVKSITYTYK